MGKNKKLGRKSSCSLPDRRLYRKYLISFSLLLAAMILGGCSLAVPEAGTEHGSDRLIGAFITQEYLDLYDMDSFFQDHAGQLVNGKQFSGADLSGYQRKLYAAIDKNGSLSPSDWDVSFPGVEGIRFFSPLWTDENGENYRADVYDSRISEKDIAYNVFDNGESVDLSGTLYVVPGAYGEFAYYLNPVYQTPEGEIYLVSGQGSSARIVDEVSEGEQSSLTYEVKENTEDGNAETENVTVAVKLAVMYKPVKITFCQMDAGHKMLQEKAYDPKEVPDQLHVQEGTAYILAETEKESPSGKKVVSRAVCENREGEVLESFYEAEHGVVIKRETEVEW